MKEKTKTHPIHNLHPMVRPAAYLKLKEQGTAEDTTADEMMSAFLSVMKECIANQFKDMEAEK